MVDGRAQAPAGVAALGSIAGVHGIGRDTEAGRREFEERMEGRRLEETDPEALKSLRRGWCLGGEAFKQAMLRQARRG